ncbi:MAG TPA: hypothetical protein VGW96_03855 [Candidatus Eremiobacteraceae bacterium]|jgi:hypothetical protein|nr:hypothetical protein [Candidatus Eremiobacteraceae bacterium]
MDEHEHAPEVPQEEEDFGVSMPPNARIGTLVFELPQHRVRIQLADGGDERLVVAEEIRSLYGARIRHVSVTRTPPKAQGVALSSTALKATGRLPHATFDPGQRTGTEVVSEELYYAIALRIDKLPELWYLNASSFNFRKALEDTATYSTELNLKEFVRRLARFAPDAVRDGFFTAVLQGSPLPPPLESLLEFFRLVSR